MIQRLTTKIFYFEVEYLDLLIVFDQLHRRHDSSQFDNKMDNPNNQTLEHGVTNKTANFENDLIVDGSTIIKTLKLEEKKIREFDSPPTALNYAQLSLFLYFCKYSARSHFTP